MANYPLIIIGERINPGFKSVKALLDADDFAGIQQVALKQAQAGARYLDVNLGPRAVGDPAFVRAVVKAVQEVTDTPLCFDFPEPSVQKVCLECYDAGLAKGRKPLVNSVAETRWEIFDLLRIQPFKVILMASERVENGVGRPNKTAAELAAVAKRMTAKVLAETPLTPDDIFIDVSIRALAADTEGLVRMGIDGIRSIGSDPAMKGVHISGAISNLTQQLPAKTAGGEDLKSLLERAFLTLTVPHGLDALVGTPWKDHSPLPPDHPVLVGLQEIIELKGYDALRRLRKLYRG
jgi:cobalamin-dependent methionine synthase I